MKIQTRADLIDAEERGEVLGEFTPEDLRKKANGIFYRFDCMDADLSAGYYSAGLFDSLQEAREIAYKHEATLTRHSLQDGRDFCPVVEETRYQGQSCPDNGDVFAPDLQKEVSK